MLGKVFLHPSEIDLPTSCSSRWRDLLELRLFELHCVCSEVGPESKTMHEVFSSYPTVKQITKTLRSGVGWVFQSISQPSSLVGPEAFVKR